MPELNSVPLELPLGPLMWEINSRLTSVEAQFHTVLPTLATKADLAELKTDMQAGFSKMHRWIAATCLSLILGIGGLGVAMMNIVQSSAELIAHSVAAQQAHR